MRGWCAHVSRRYYVFSETGESSWFPPKWIDVYDDNTGYYYYTNTKVHRSTSLSPVAPWLYLKNCTGLGCSARYPQPSLSRA